MTGWNMSRWKALELEICRIFGGSRSGPQGKEGPDCKGTAPFAVQVKHGLKIPKWLIKDMKQTIGDASPGDLPVLVLHPKGKRVEHSIVCIRLSDFREWYL